MSAPARVEITDLIRTWRVDGTRVPVVLAEVVDRLEASGQRRAARVVRRLPAVDGVLDDAALDALMVRVHCELQRLSEELVMGRRVREHLTSLVASLGPGPVRVVDIGCGVGFTLRWLAAHGGWGSQVELVGADLDETLVDAARGLADAEGLPVRFVTGDAFAPGTVVDDPSRTVMISAGLMHHLRGVDLERFFAAQQQLGVPAFVHWDPVPGALSVLGAWMFHQGRMREPVSRHDGVLSVRRAHRAPALLTAAAAGAPAYDLQCVDDRHLVRVLRPITGRLR